MIDGYQGFHKKFFVEQPGLYAALSRRGQSPKFMVIACCDSRVHPAQVLDSAPGELFVVRNVANLVPACAPDDDSCGTGAALEFAVQQLAVKHIIILGHSQCGGIKRLLEGGHDDRDYRFIDPWLQTAQPARERVLTEHADTDFAERCCLCERASISLSLANLITFPWIRERHAAGELYLHGWHFDLGTGALVAKQGAEFVPVDDLKIN